MVSGPKHQKKVNGQAIDTHHVSTQCTREGSCSAQRTHLIDEGMQRLHEAFLVLKVRNKKFDPCLQMIVSGGLAAPWHEREHVLLWDLTRGADLQEGEHSKLHHMEVIGVPLRLG